MNLKVYDITYGETILESGDVASRIVTYDTVFSNQGAEGPVGPQGPLGPANTLSIGTVTTGAAGSNASATITGAAPSQVLSLSIPRGNTGATGATGATGPANTLSIGTVTTGSAGSSAAATITGTSPNQTLNLTIPRGDQGNAGTGIELLTTQGDILYRGSSTGQRLPIGATGQVLKVSSGGLPAWQNESGHTHTSAAITDFAAAVVAAAPPTTNASLLTSGTLPDARLSSNIARTSDVTGAVAAVVNAAPASLDTLKELADALGNDANFASTVTNSLASKAPSSRTISTGTGLTGGGDLSSNRTLAVSFGSSAGTACEGNDARLSDARTPSSTLAHAASHFAGVKASFYGQVAGMTQNVILRANTVGTAGNSITLVFDGVTELGETIVTWNTDNPSNQVTLVTGNYGDIPDNGEEITLSGGVAAGSDPFKNINQDLGNTDAPQFDKLGLGEPASGNPNCKLSVLGNSDTQPAAIIRGAQWFGSVDGNQGVLYQGDVAGKVKAIAINSAFTQYRTLELVSDGDTFTFPASGGTLATTGDIPANTIASTIVDAKGDLIVGTAADTVARLPVGATNGHVLTVDSAEASGIKWAAASGGVTAVSGTAPIVSSGGTTPAISISAATTSAAGSMSAADKTKLDAITGTNTGDQTITLTGDVTGSGTGSFAATIANNAVTNAKLAQVATSTIKGRATAATGNVEDLTATQVRSIINVADGATANSSDATLLNRANHTGTQAAGTITGLAAIATSGSASDLGSGTVPIAQIPTGSTSTTVALGNHAHGNLTSGGAIGSTAGLPVVTTTSGAVTTLALGTANQVLKVNSGGTAVEFGAAGGVTSGSVDNAVLRADGTGGSTSQSSDINIEDATTSTQNNVQISNQHSGQTNSALVLTPKGTGAFIVGARPTGSATTGNARGANATDLQQVRSAATQVASGTRSGIMCGTLNTNAGLDAFLGGGDSCSINSNGSYAFIGGGDGNSVTAYAASIVGGFSNVASNQYATTWGYDNTASGISSTAFGVRALADRESLVAVAGGRFASDGDAQRIAAILRGKTTTNAAVELLMGLSNNIRLTIASGKVMAMLINITGVKSDGSAVAHYVRQYAIKNVGGTTSEVYASVTIGTDNAAGTSITLSANDTNDAVKIEATGIASETWRWVASVDAVEVAYGT